MFRRPEEFVPALFFFVALAGYLRKGSWRHDLFEHWLVLSIIVGLMGQAVFMSLSGHLFDTMFDTAHTLKKVSYILVLLGFLISMYHLFKRADDSAKALSDINADLARVAAEREQAKHDLEKKSEQLKSTLDNISQGLAMFDKEHNLVTWNQQYVALLETPRELVHVGASLESLLRDAAKRGMSGLATTDEQVTEKLESLRQNAREHAELSLPRGRVIDLRREPMPDGGFINTFTDITDLLSFSQIGTQSGALEPTDCRDIVDAALKNLSVALEESSAEVTVDDLPTVDADALQLVSVFQNLIGNAIKFRGAHTPCIHIKAERIGQEWSFAISDNGIGIDREHAERIFVIFQRLHARSEYDGTGISLAMCKMIVERHNGRIWVESEPGQGTTFHFNSS